MPVDVIPQCREKNVVVSFKMALVLIIVESKKQKPCIVSIDFVVFVSGRAECVCSFRFKLSELAFLKSGESMRILHEYNQPPKGRSAFNSTITPISGGQWLRTRGTVAHSPACERRLTLHICQSFDSLGQHKKGQMKMIKKAEMRWTRNNALANRVNESENDSRRSLTTCYDATSRKFPASLFKFVRALR